MDLHCVALGCVIALAACGGETVTGRAALHDCPDYTKPASCADAPSFAKTVQPILLRSCVPCHWNNPDPNAQWPLTDYGDVAAWNDLIKTSLLGCSQPPPGAPVTFTEADRATILNWTLCNHPP
ncbi:MAG TPA: hypothetical protein VHJ20_22715 [Polyangia bacterium]|nr:hypothetical protein [Polyangia bacterium]